MLRKINIVLICVLVALCSLFVKAETSEINYNPKVVEVVEVVEFAVTENTTVLNSARAEKEAVENNIIAASSIVITTAIAINSFVVVKVILSNLARLAELCSIARLNLRTSRRRLARRLHTIKLNKINRAKLWTIAIRYHICAAIAPIVVAVAIATFKEGEAID